MSTSTVMRKTRPNTVVLIGSDELDRIVLPVAAALNKRGIESLHLDISTATEELPDLMQDAAVVYGPGAFPVTLRHLGSAPLLRAIISIYTGTEGFDEAAASEHNIVVANGQAPENSESLAEATVLLILAALYDLAGAERQMYPEASLPRRSATMLRGKTVGLIGFGQIGRGVATRLEQWNVRLLITTPRPRPPFPEGAIFTSLDGVLTEADVICVLAPLTPETTHLLNYERLSKTKRGAVIVNVSRGALIDEQALCTLAGNGHFSAVALDVFETEPLPINSPLRRLSNAILTPHALGHTRDSMEGLVEAGIENICRVLDGQPPLYIRNPEILPQWRRKWSSSEVSGTA